MCWGKYKNSTIVMRRENRRKVKILHLALPTKKEPNKTKSNVNYFDYSLTVYINIFYQNYFDYGGCGS